MQLSHTPAATSAIFDDPNLVSSAGLVPALRLATSVGLRTLADTHLSVPTDKGANPGLKVASLVAGMVAGADSIDDMALLRHGGMKKLFTSCYAPSTLGSFLRSFTFGHVRQLDAVASRTLTGLSAHAPLVVTDPNEYVYVDVDDTIVEVHGHKKQGSGYGYSRVRGLNALLATVTTKTSAPVIVAQRLRKGSTGSPRGAARLIGDALATTGRMNGLTGARTLIRADSAFYGHAAVSAAITSGADVSVTVRMDPRVKKAITTIEETAWKAIKYTDAIYDEDTSNGSPTLKSPKCPSPLSPRRRRTTRSRAGSSCAGFRNCARRTSISRPCSIPTGSTRSSPPARWTPSRLIRRTGPMR